MQIIVTTLNSETLCLECEESTSVNSFTELVSQQIGIPASQFMLADMGGEHRLQYSSSNQDLDVSFVLGYTDVAFVQVELSVLGGIDFQHREGSKIGSGGHLSESQAALERKERLRKLALETIDITKDPYIIKNNLGTFECKLCLTVHPNEGNYLAHTQGKRHQYNLGRRAAMEAKNAGPRAMSAAKEAPKRTVLKIGRPGYKVSKGGVSVVSLHRQYIPNRYLIYLQVTKSRDLRTMQRALTFEVEYPEAEAGSQPRHRFMSAFEQKVEVADKNFQYVLFACDPYETIAFKIPNHPIDRQEGRFFTSWDATTKKFVLQLYFQPDERPAATGSAAVPTSTAAPVLSN